MKQKGSVNICKYGWGTDPWLNKNTFSGQTKKSKETFKGNMLGN